MALYWPDRGTADCVIGQAARGGGKVGGDVVSVNPHHKHTII